MSNYQNQQGIDEDDLKGQFRQKELFSFTGHLARKGGPKSYTVAKRSAYQLNYLAILGGDVLRIAAAFLAIFFFFKGIFAVTGSAADYIAGGGAAVLLLALEVRQWQNATALMERWFFKSTISRPNILWAIVLSLITLGLSLWGLPHTVSELSPTVQKQEVKLLDEGKETAGLLSQIDAAGKDAENFKASGAWRGRLSAEDRKKYNALLLNVKDLRDTLSREKSRIRAENQKRMDEAGLDYLAQVKMKMDKDNSYSTYLAIILLLTELLFWVGFYHKERYEYFAYQEAVKLGKIAPKGTAPLQRNISDEKIRELVEDAVKKQTNGSANGNGAKVNP